MTEPIPGPPGLPLLGNMADLNPADATNSLIRFAHIYGPIYKLNLGGEDRIFISSRDLLNEICDEKRFQKRVGGALEQIRNGVQDGLFTAYPGEHNWEVAHRVLMPAFGLLSIRAMFDEMYDIATQLVAKWARFGPEEIIHVTDDFTRLTLDSIALCAMGTRFNSFYHEEMHPFVTAMVGLLEESGRRAARPQIATLFMRSAQKKYDEDIALLKKVASDLLADRRAHPNDKKDLLNAMIKGRDPKTGEGLTDATILNNMITFLIAGHETTSGMLSFLFYNLLKNPSAYQTAQHEVDEVVGRGPVTLDHMSKLPYIEACLRETLRLTPTAPAFTVQAKPDIPEDPVIIGGKYEVKKGQAIAAILAECHRDPAVYGPDADEFNPERMLDDNFAKLPPNAWKPFGNGMRGCIGRPFAWQESVLAVAMLLQNFNFRLHDPAYQLEIKQTLTIKPKDFFMHASLRDHIDPINLEKNLYVPTNEEGKTTTAEKKVGASGVPVEHKKPMTILYGSNAGTCEALAQTLARAATGRGYNVTVDPLDSVVDKVPENQPVILISSSYEGQPPDNAAHFVEWLQKLEDDSKLKNVKYAVYGCGNHDWVSTFHRIPKLIDSEFQQHGAKRIAEIGLGDVAKVDIFNEFDRWQDEQLWTQLGGSADSDHESVLEVEIDTTTRRSHLRQNLREGIVIDNDLLTAPGEPEKRHISLELPTGMTYNTGDYLAVLPMNNPRVIRRVLKRFGLPWDAVITIKEGANTTLPTGRPISVMDILSSYVELAQPATVKHLARIAASSSDPAVEAEIKALGPDFEKEITAKRRSPLDLLEKYPAAALTFGEYLAMLPPMRIRQYSISSSPLFSETTVTITWSVLDTPSYAEGDKQRFLGVASNYLSTVEKGERIHVTVKPSHGIFHPPKDIENTAIIMIGAGSGLAPFRGFIQERACQKAAGRKLAPAYLFIGCGHPDKDALFKEELEAWQKDGVVEVFYAYSRASELSKGCRHVQERLWEEREEMTKAFTGGAKLFVCGSSKVGEGVAETTKKMFRQWCKEVGRDVNDEEVEDWFQKIKSDRYASDVFA
ncbi:hypothetical protein B7463_g6139, partial [Scytalidium lignicola]